MRRAFKLTGVLLTLLMLTSFTKPNPPKKKLDTVSLLNESYALLAQIDDSSQVFYLLPLTQVGAKVISPREEEWCIRLFRQSSSVSDQWDRVALEKNALVELSAVNSDAAMELFWQVEEPASDARGRRTF